MNQRVVFLIGFPALWAVLWISVAVLSSSTRPALPGLELPMLAVAWDMWQHDAFLISSMYTHHQGSSVSGGFPLYLWLTHGVWALFGVSDVWPRVVSSALGLSCTAMVAALCRAVWPGWSGLGALAGTLAMGMIGWLVTSSMSGSQVLLTLCVLLAMYGVVMAWRHGTWNGFVLAGIGLGLGFLTDGLSILIHVVPVALLAPLWAPALGWNTETVPQKNTDKEARLHGWRGWYMGLAGSVLIAVAVVSAWIIPLGMSAGTSVALDIVLGAFRAVSGGTGNLPQSWWVYLLALGVFLFPWIIWPPAWRAVVGTWSLMKDGGGRFCLIWLLFSVAASAVMPGTGVLDVALHVPSLAMIAAYLLYLRIDPELARQETERRFGNGEAGLGLIVALTGLVLIVVPLSGGIVSLPWWIEGLSGIWGAVLIAIAAAAAYAAPRLVIFRAAFVASLMVLVVLVGMLAASPVLQTQVNVYPVAEHLRRVLDQDAVVAFAGPRGPVMDFPARLERPLDTLDPEDSIGVVAWAVGNPGGKVVVVMDELPMGGKPDAIYPYRGEYIVFWPSETVADHPEIVVGPVRSEPPSG